MGSWHYPQKSITHNINIQPTGFNRTPVGNGIYLQAILIFNQVFEKMGDNVKVGR
jgi:hypothetical protein